MKNGKRVLGIDIGTFSTKIVEGTYSDKLRVNRYGIFPTLRVMRDQNTITNLNEYAAGLKRTLKRNRFKAKECYVSFSSDDIIIRKMRLPRMNEDQIRKNLEVELREYLPVKVENYAIDFRILRRDIEEGEESHGYELMVVAMLKEVAFQYISMLRKAGLKPKAIDLAVNSQGKLMRVLLGREEFEHSVLGFVDIGQQYTSVSIYQDGIYYVSKVIAWGIHNLEDNSKTNEEHGDQLAWEINRVLDFYHTQNYMKPISKLYVIGGGSLDQRIYANMRRQLEQATSSVKEFSDYASIDGAIKKKSDLYIIFNALALLIREEQ